MRNLEFSYMIPLKYANHNYCPYLITIKNIVLNRDRLLGTQRKQGQEMVTLMNMKTRVLKRD